jgi:hypothetical protein
MKKLSILLLLSILTVAAHAEKNHKAVAKNKTIQPKLQEPAVTPTTDTAWHGTGNEHRYGQRELDPRIGRSMYVAPAPPAKK